MREMDLRFVPVVAVTSVPRGVQNANDSERLNFMSTSALSFPPTVCSDPNYDPVGCNDPLCAYGDCNTAVTDPIDYFGNNPGSVGLATHASENGGTAIASGGTWLTSILNAVPTLASSAVQTNAALNAPKPTSGFTLPGVGSVGTFGSSGMFMLALVGLLLYFVFGRKHRA